MKIELFDDSYKIVVKLIFYGSIILIYNLSFLKAVKSSFFNT